jgi:predicted house-cleaning noncanonical NTP pyrophosphatase (MazG superfamily)
MSKKSLQERITSFMVDNESTNLMHELSTQRAMMQIMVEWMTDEADSENLPDMLEKIIKLNDVIGRQAERISTIEQRHALTAGQVLYLQAVVIDILKTYIEDPRKLERATYDLADRLGFSVAQNKNALAVNTNW